MKDPDRDYNSLCNAIRHSVSGGSTIEGDVSVSIIRDYGFQVDTWTHYEFLGTKAKVHGVYDNISEFNDEALDTALSNLRISLKGLDVSVLEIGSSRAKVSVQG